MFGLKGDSMSDEFFRGVIWTLGIQFIGALALSLVLRETWRYTLGVITEKTGKTIWNRLKLIRKEFTDGKAEGKRKAAGSPGKAPGNPGDEAAGAAPGKGPGTPAGEAAGAAGAPGPSL